MGLMKKYAFSKYVHEVSLGLLMAGLLLLGGCATESAPKVTVQQQPSPRQDYRHRRSYNRPYRVKGVMYYPMLSPEGYSEIGIASWYGHESGAKTSMGARFWPEGTTAAHKTLPLPSKVRVTNLHNGRSVIVTVNDRGPFKRGRIIDLSRGAARKLGVRGLARVKVDYLGGAN